VADLNVGELIREGSAAARAGDVESAQRFYRQALELDETDIEAWLGLSGVVDSEEEKRRCFYRVLELDADNEEAKAGLAWLDKAAGRVEEEERGDDEALYCANHPDTETLLRCNRCGKPICTRCAVRTPVGLRCKECVAEQQQVYFTARSYDNLVVATVTFVLTAGASFLVLFVMRMIPFSWLITFLVTPMVAGILAEIVRRSVGRRRGRNQPLVIAISAALGSFAGLFIIWMVAGTILPYLLIFGIFIVMLISAMYARTR